VRLASVRLRISRGPQEIRTEGRRLEDCCSEGEPLNFPEAGRAVPAKSVFTISLPKINQFFGTSTPSSSIVARKEEQRKWGIEDMKTSQRSNQDRPKEPQGRPSGTGDTQTLPQLFVRDLAHCPRFDRAAEYTLACQLRSARLQLVTSLKAQHERLVALLGEPSLPSSYDTISEAEILRLLNSVQVRVDRAGEQETSRDIMALQNWLARVRRDLRRFHEYRDEMVRRPPFRGHACPTISTPRGEPSRSRAGRCLRNDACGRKI